MAQRVQYGDAGAILEFPDELSRDEIASILKAKGPELNARFSKGRLASAGAEFARGAGEGTGKSLPAITRALDIILEGPAALGWEPFLNPFSKRRNEIMTPEFQAQSEELAKTRTERVAESPIAQAGETAAEYWREEFQPNPKYAHEFFAGTLPRAAGGTMPTIATAMIAGPAAAAVQYGAVAGEQAREEAIKAGKPEVADRAFLTSAGLGALSEFSLGVPANIMRFIKSARSAGVAPEVVGAEFKKELGTRINEWLSKHPVARAFGEATGRESAQEGIEQGGQNWIASELAGYDIGRPLTQGVLEASAAGGILGFVFGGGAHGVGRIAAAQEERAAERSQDEAFEVASKELAREKAALLTNPRNILGTEQGVTREFSAPASLVSDLTLARQREEEDSIQEAIRNRRTRTQEEPSALPVQSSATLPLRETPADRQTMGPGVPLAEIPSRAPAPQEEEIVQEPPKSDVAPVVFNSVLSVPGLPPVVYYDPITPIQTSDKGTYEAGRIVTENILTKSGFTIPPEERAKAEAEIARQAETPIAQVTPAVAAVPAAASEERPDPLDVAADFLEMVNFASRDPAYVGAPFKENLPTDLVSLGDTLVKGGKVEGRTETLRFAFVRDNDSGEIHLLPAWKNARQTIMLRLPGQAAGKGTNLGSFIGRKAADTTSPKFTVLASVLLKQPAHSFPTTFTQEEYDAIRDQARTQAGEIVASEQALHRVEQATEESVEPADASGVTPELLSRIFDAIQATPDTPLLDVMLANRKLFEELNSQTDWSASTVWNQLKKADLPNATFDQFHQTFDPIGYSPSPGGTERLPEVPAVLGQPSGAAEQTDEDQTQAPDARFSIAQTFYSRLTRTVEKSQQNKASGAQWKATIRNSKLGVNADEFALVGVNDLEDGRTYTKQEVLEYLKANEVVVKDVTLGGEDAWKLENSRLFLERDNAKNDLIDLAEKKFGSRQQALKLVESVQRGYESQNYIRDELGERHPDLYEAINRYHDGLNRYGRSTQRRTAESGEGAAHFSTYQLPGAKEGSYREVLLTVPERGGRAEWIDSGPQVLNMELRGGGYAPVSTHEWTASIGGADYRITYNPHQLRFALNGEKGGIQNASFQTLESAQAAAEKGSNYKYSGRGWRDGHSQYSDIANPIVRLRFNERTTADGKRMFFLEEVQPPQKGEFDKMPALFQKNWREIGFKWALRYAAENGFEVFGWTTGEQQASRYDLSKQVDSINWGESGQQMQWVKIKPVGEPSISILVDKDGIVRDANDYIRPLNARLDGKQLSDVVGKEVAKEITSKYHGELTGEGLKIGGVGLKKLYDVDFRNVVNNLPAVKKAGQKVGTANISGTKQPYEVWYEPDGGERSYIGDFATKAEAERVVQQKGYGHVIQYNASEAHRVPLNMVDNVHSIAITPAIRESVMGGQSIASVARFPAQAEPLDAAPILQSIFSGVIPARIRVVNNPSAKTDRGHPRAGMYSGGIIELNMAFIPSEQELRRVLREELVHSVANDPKVAKEFKRLFDAVTDEDLRAAFGEGYSPDVAREEAVIDYIERLPEDDGIWKRLWQSVRDAISRAWGIRTLAELFGADFTDSDARAVTAYAYRRILRESNENSKDDPARFSLASYVFRNEQQKRELIERAQKAGVDPSGIAEAEQMAGVQAGLIPATFVSEATNLVASPPKTVERATGELLRPILDIGNLSISPQSIAAMPRGTDEQVRESELAAGTVLSQHLFIKDQTVDFTRQVAEANDELTKAMALLSEAQIKESEAAFASAMTDTLIEKYDAYLGDTRSLATQSGNVNLELDTLLDKSVQQLTEMRPQHSSISKALAILAANVPGGLTTSADVVQWAISSNVLVGKVGQATIQFLLHGKTLPGIQTVLVPPLAQYTDLPAALLKMKNVIANKRAVQQDITAFKTWFAGVRKPSEVGPLRFAREYYKLRRQKELAADVAARINKDIDRADTRVRSLVEASDFVERMTVDPQYLESVRIASSYSNAIVQKLASIDPVTRQIKWAGPLGGNYVFDFSPDTLSSVESMNQVQQLIAEIDAFSGDPQSDPLLVKSWQNQKDYLNLSLVSSAATPQAGSAVGGFAAGRGQLVLDIYDWINLAAARKLVSSQNVLNRIATKASNHASLAFQATDAFLEPLRQVNENKDYGVKAIANKFVDAMTAHKFIPKDTRQRYKYEFLILEPIIASLQNNLSRHYRIGDKVDGKYPVMKEDMALIDSMKKYTAEIQRFANPPGTTGSPALRFNPSQIEREIGEVTYSTKQLGTGPSVMPRLSSQWGSEFTREWLKNPDPVRRLNLLRDDLNFRGAVLRRIHDANTAEYTATSKLQEYYDEIDQGLWAGTVTLDTFDDLVDHIATAKQASEPATTVREQRDIVKAIILEDVTSDVTSFSDKFLNAPRDERQLKTIPESLRHILTGRNSFTSPRGKLVAPSSYYAYSVASDPRKAQFIASARLLFELRQLEALDNLRVVLEDALAKMEKPVSEASGVIGRFKAKRRARLRSVKEAREGDSQVTYQELKLHVAKLRTLFNEQERLLQREYQEPDHVAWGFAHGLTGYHASMLLGKPQPAVTNFIGGVLLAPSLIRARQGQVLRSMATLGTTPYHLAELAVSRVALMLRNRPALAGVWNKNKAQWGIIARTIADMADYYSNISNHALATGAVAPYDLRGRQKLLWKLRNTGGRLEFNEPSLSMNALNQIGTIPGLSQAVSWWKSINPRWVDQMVNLLNTQEALLMLDQLKGYGFQAWQSHESTYGPDWKNLSDAKNLLTPQELGSGTAKGASFTRQLFNASGSIDKILLDFYERTKGMTPEQRAAAPLFEDEGAQNAFLMEYLKMTNLPTQSNRPPAFRGGIARPLVTLFMGYPAALGEQISELFRTHTKDAGAGARITSIAIPFILLAMVILYGMMSREAGQELTEAWTGKASSQLRLANVLSDSASSEDAARYAIVSVANLIPFFGDAANRMIGGVASKPVLDLTAMIPVATMVNDIGNTIFKAGQSRDPIYPLADFGKRWFPPLEPVLNRIPMFEGDLAQRNVQAALRAVAPGDMEVKQGFGSSVPRLTPTSPIIRDLVAAAYLGDTETVRAKYAEAVAEKARQGVPEPERAVWATLQSQLPSRKVFGRLPTAGEESRLLSRMTDSQRGTYDRSKSAFGLISEAVGGGKEIAFTDQSEPAAVRRPRLGGTIRRSRLGRRGRTRSLSGLGARRIGGRTGLRRRGTRRRVGFGSRRRSLIA